MYTPVTTGALTPAPAAEEEAEDAPGTMVSTMVLSEVLVKVEDFITTVTVFVIFWVSVEEGLGCAAAAAAGADG